MSKKAQKATNIYLNKKSANSFEKSAELNPEVLSNIGSYIIDELRQNKNNLKFIRFLDIGSGTGRTILNVLLGIKEKNIDFKADCFEISDYMIKIFNENITSFKSIQKDINIIKHDANNELTSFGIYDIAMIVSVLQYIDNWRLFIDDVLSHLKNDSFFVIAELIGWYRFLDGTIEDDNNFLNNEFDLKFWKLYFKERSSYGSWPPEVCFSKQEPVYDYLNEKGMSAIREKDFLWKGDISWADVLSWIEIGPLSSLGSNIIDQKDREKLSVKMRDFLKQNNQNINSEFNTSWGFKIKIFSKK